MSGQLIGRGYITIAGLKDGDPAKTYVLIPSVDSITKKLDGTLSVTGVTCSVYKVTGSSAYALTSDHTLSYVRTPDGAGGILIHAAGTSGSIAVLATTESIEFELKDGSKVIDRVRVPVLSDATDVNNELDTYSYLKEALAKQGTVADHGLLLTSLIALGYTDSNNVRHTLAGTNGIYVPKLGGRTIGSWWGGDMLDLFKADDTRKTYDELKTESGKIAPLAATSLVRMDGSAYFANGNIGFKADGSGWLGNENGIKWTPLGALTIGAGVTIDVTGDDGVKRTLTDVANFITAVTSLLAPADANGKELQWNQVAQAQTIMAKKTFFSLGGVSAKGIGSSTGGGGSVFGLYTDSTWAATPSTTDALGAVLGKSLHTRISALEGKNYLDELTLAEAGTGNAVTDVSLSNDKKTLTVTYGASYLSGITKAMVEGVLTGNITTHTHSQYLTSASLSGYYSKTQADERFQPKGNYVTDVTLNDYYTKPQIYNSPIIVYISRFVTLDFDEPLLPQSLSGTPTVLYDTVSKTLVAMSGYPIRPSITNSDGIFTNWVGAEGMGSVLTATRGWTPRSDVLYYNLQASEFYRWDGSDMVAVDELNDMASGGGLDESQLADYLTTNNYAKKSDIPSLSGYATQAWVTGKGYLTSSSLHTLTIQKNGTTVGTYKPNADATINIADVASAATLENHLNNTTNHVAGAEKLLWNQTATKLNAILGEDSDTIINKWEEVVAFLDTYTEADTLANLLSNKVDKVSGKGLSTNDFTDAYRDKLNGLTNYSLPTATETVKGGVKVGSGLAISAQVLSVNLSASHIPSLPWSKITSGKPTTLSGYGITDAKIENGVITLGGKTITPITSHQSIHALTIKGNGTSLLTYNPKTEAAEIDITATKIGASPSNHTHTQYAPVTALNSLVPWSKRTVAYTNGTNLNPQFINIENENLISGYANYWSVINLGSYTSSGFRTQIAMPYQNSLTDSDLFIRTANGADWRAWRKVLHDGNTKITNGTITINGTSITPLVQHQSLANYVTTNTAQRISGGKTFNNGALAVRQDKACGLTFYSFGDSDTERVAAIEILGASGSWLKNSLDFYKSGRIVARNSFTATSIIKSGGTASQFLMADGSVATKHTLSSVTNLGWGGTSGQIATINTIAYWNGQYGSGASNLQYCDRGRFGTMATMDAADYPTVERFNSGVAFMAGKFPDGGVQFNVMHDEDEPGVGNIVNIPTKTSHLTNDSGFLTGSGADAKYVTALRVTGDALTWVKNGLGNNITLPYAAESRVLRSYGRITAVTDNTAHGVGVRLFEAYHNGYPTTYGNVLAVQGSTAIGGGELLMGWSGANEGHASLYYRNRRDTASANWSAWATILDSVNYSTTLDSRYLKKAGDMMTGELTIKTSAFGGQLNIFRNDTGGNSVIKYTNAEKLLGYIGIGGSGGVFPYEPMFSGENGTWYKILHSGNYSSVLNNVYAATSRVGALESTVSGHTSQINGLTGSVGAKVSKAGDTMTGDLLFSDSGTATRQVRFMCGGNDYGRIAAGATATNAGWMEIASADDGNEPIYARQYSGAFTSLVRTATLLDASGNTAFPGRVNASYFTANSTTLCTNLNADLLDGLHVNSYGNANGVVRTFHFGSVNATRIWIKVGTLPLPSAVGSGQSYVDFEVTGLVNFGYNSSSTMFVHASTRGSARVEYSSLGGGTNCPVAYYKTTSTNVEIWLSCTEQYSGMTVIEFKRSYSNFTPVLTSQTTDPTGLTAGVIANGNFNTASATKLQTARTLWGQSFNGTGNVDGTLRIQANESNYCEGIRIKPTGEKWTTIVLGGSDLTANSGTSAKSWSIHNNDGKFYINMNGAGEAKNARAMATSTGWTFGNTSRNTYALNAASFICDSWVRTVGSAGWYSETYGGGWCMTDSTWIRIHGGKSLYAASGIIRTDGELQVGGGGDKFRVTAAGAVTATSFTKRGGTASQILAADGSVRGFWNHTIGNAAGIPLVVNPIALGNSDGTENLMIDALSLSSWNGAYTKPGSGVGVVGSTPVDTISNLAYCVKGKFGDIVTHNASEFLTSTSVSNKAATLSWNTAVTVAAVGGTNITVKLPANPNTDTKNTAGSTDTASKIFLIGATSQAANPQTYSHDTAYVGTDGCLYSGGAKVLTSHQSLANYVTLNTAQTVSGRKTFSDAIINSYVMSFLFNYRGSTPAANAYGVMFYKRDTYFNILRTKKGAPDTVTFDHGGSLMEINLATNAVTFAGVVTASNISTSSDARLKTRIEDIALPIADIAAAPLWRYRRKDTGVVDVGSTAQYWGAILPELTRTDEQGWMSLDYGKTALLASVSLARKADDHEARIKALEAENRALKQEIERIKAA